MKEQRKYGKKNSPSDEDDVLTQSGVGTGNRTQTKRSEAFHSTIKLYPHIVALFATFII